MATMTLRGIDERIAGAFEGAGKKRRFQRQYRNAQNSQGVPGS